MVELTERRKADRKRMSEELYAICETYEGLAIVQLTPEGMDKAYPRAAIVEVQTSRGLTCRFEFDGESCQPDTYVNAWHFITDSDTCLSDSFPGSVNNYHFRKSTTACDGFAALRAHVVAVLEGDRDGWIYDEARTAAHIAENGSWQDRAARWEQYRAEMRIQQEPAA